MEAVKYGECCKSHLRFWWKTDGCQEYKECRASPLACQTCGCHRNFHREVEVRRSFTNEVIKRKTTSLLEEFFRVQDFNETFLCFVQLKSPEYHPQLVREAISLALKKGPPGDDEVSLLFEYLFERKVLKAKDVGSGCLLYAMSLCDLAIYMPKAPDMFGKIIGNLLVFVQALELKVANEILGVMRDINCKKAVFDAATKVVDSHPYGEDLLVIHRLDYATWKSHF